MLKHLFVHKIVVYLPRVFHSIRFKVNRGAAVPHYFFLIISSIILIILFLRV